MKKMLKHIIAVMAVVLFVAAVSACPRQEGPAEQAGKQVDEAVEQGGEQLEEAGENVEDAAEGQK